MNTGNNFMTDAIAYMSTLDWLAQQCVWCYKCSAHCCHHYRRDFGHLVGLFIAGTVCKPFSTMSTKKARFMCKTAIAALAWCFQVLAVRPEYAIHECVAGFGTEWFEKVLCSDSRLYLCQSVVWDILDQGDPVRRLRRYTIFSRMDVIWMYVGWTYHNLSTRFFHNQIYTGNAFFICTPQQVLEFMKFLAAKLHLVVDEETPFLDCIPAGYQQRLEQYKRLLRRMMQPWSRYLVNICQTAKWARCTKGNAVVPTLLTETSWIWSLRLNRLMHPLEKLFAQGLSLNQDWGVLKALSDGSLDFDDVSFMAGNMMHLKACATSFCFVLFGSRRSGIPGRLMVPVGESSDDEDFVNE